MKNISVRHRLYSANNTQCDHVITYYLVTTLRTYNGNRIMSPCRSSHSSASLAKLFSTEKLRTITSLRTAGQPGYKPLIVP